MPITKHRPKHLIQDSGLYFITGHTYAGLPHLYSSQRKAMFKKILFEKIKKFNFSLRAWIVLDHHYHLLIGVGIENGTSKNRSLKAATSNINDKAATSRSASHSLPHFINELHGKSAFKIKKLPPVMINAIEEETQLIWRKRTPMEERIEKRLEKVINELATFTSRLNPKQLSQIQASLKNKDKPLAKLLLATFLPKSFDIPFWYQYTDHLIRNEKDYWQHFNYIHQNCIKHGKAKNLWQYSFSSIHHYDKSLISDSFRKYPIIDFTPEAIAA